MKYARIEMVYAKYYDEDDECFYDANPCFRFHYPNGDIKEMPFQPDFDDPNTRKLNEELGKNI